VESSQCLADFRPISLVGCFYKALANRLRNVITNEVVDAIMGRMNFLTLWRKWIMECVSTTTTYILSMEVRPESLTLKEDCVQETHFIRFYL